LGQPEHRWGRRGTITLGTSASATNPQRSGQVGTGLFSTTTNTVSIAANSADVADFTTTGESVTGSITVEKDHLLPLRNQSRRREIAAPIRLD
jgi:hypothetical protein